MPQVQKYISILLKSPKSAKMKQSYIPIHSELGAIIEKAMMKNPRLKKIKDFKNGMALMKMDGPAGD